MDKDSFFHNDVEQFAIYMQNIFKIGTLLTLYTKKLTKIIYLNVKPEII